MKKDRTVPRYFLMPPVAAMVDGAAARVVDLGLKGARVELATPVIPGCAVQFRIGSILMIGTVLWCQIDALHFTSGSDGYLAGIAFERASTAIDELLTDISARGEAIRIEDLRCHDRYRITTPLTGTYGEIAPVSIMDISVEGARIRMTQRLLPGHEQTLRFQVDDQTGPITVMGRVQWCRPSPVMREHHAGLFIDGGHDVLRKAIDRLCTRNEARIDLDSLKRKFEALRLVSDLDEIPHRMAV